MKRCWKCKAAMADAEADGICCMRCRCNPPISIATDPHHALCDIHEHMTREEFPEDQCQAVLDAIAIMERTGP